jgi:DNA-binding NarL/FixJ family response regulator
MPGTAGVSLIEHLQADTSTRGIPIIAVTSWDGQVGNALAAGAFACCVKPIDADDFTDVVTIVLRGRREHGTTRRLRAAPCVAR